MAVAFEWDQAKDLANQQKHGVAVNEACTVLGDSSDQRPPGNPA